MEFYNRERELCEGVEDGNERNLSETGRKLAKCYCLVIFVTERKLNYDSNNVFDLSRKKLLKNPTSLTSKLFPKF